MFPQMIDVVPEAKVGVAKVTHFEITREDSMYSMMRELGDYVTEGRYAKLYVNGVLMMSDTRMERNTNYEVVTEARGNVLIAGLGLGMILHPILKKTEVTAVTVVEQCRDVISLIGPTVKSKKLSLVEGDIYTWRPAKGYKFDVIYFDIWSELSTDNLVEMARLHQAFKFYKAKGGWMNSWRRDILLSQKRSESRYGLW